MGTGEERYSDESKPEKTPKRIVFPDTNLFLHFPPLKDIDWCGLANASVVELVICITVIKELDSKKSDTRLGARAERAIREIRQAKESLGPIRDSVTLRIFNQEIRHPDFAETLSPDSADDRIVHLAKVYSSVNPGAPVAIATGDLGMELRAEAGGIDVVAMNSELRLENPADELGKKYREAITELNAIKNRLPKLMMGLSNQNGNFSVPQSVEFSLPSPAVPVDIEAEMDSIRRRYPKRNASNRNDLSTLGSSLSSLLELQFGGLISEGDWEKYDSEVDRFYKRYEKYLHRVAQVRQVQERSFWFDLWLSNEGNGLATDIDVLVEFPNNHLVFDRDAKEIRDLRKMPSPPDPPEKPNPCSSILDIHRNAVASIGMLHRQPDMSEFTRRNEWVPEVKVVHSPTSLIKTSLGKLKHSHQVRLGSFLHVFNSATQTKSFRAEVAITSAELPNKVEYKLPFKLAAKRTS